LAVREFCFAVVGSLTDPAEAERLARKYEAPLDDVALRASATTFWTRVTRGAQIAGETPDVAVLDASLPWLAHDAIVHLSVPRGLEQYTAAAWGTRDVCQGPVEFLLALEHDEAVKQILRIVFAEQYATRGDWSQWFMLEPYSSIRDSHSHGDVIVWPLKALNDYLEATSDLGFLDETASWRDDVTLQRTARADPIAAHVDKLLATIRNRFIPGTHLMRYGEGDWNDSLQPADPALRETMASSWTAALTYQQLVRHAELLRRAGRSETAGALGDLAKKMRDDVNRFLVRDGTVAGYAIFRPGAGEPELLLHPSDVRTGLRYSLPPSPRRSSGARSASCTCTRTCGTRRPWRSSVSRMRCGTRSWSSIRSASRNASTRPPSGSATRISAAATRHFRIATKRRRRGPASRPGASRSKADGESIRAVPGSTSTCFYDMRSTKGRATASPAAQSAATSPDRPARRGDARAGLEVAEGDAALAQIVGRDLQRNLVARDDADAMLAHSSGAVCDQVVPVVERDAITRIGHDFGHDPVHFEKFLFAHFVASAIERKNPATRRASS
jgi:hypothetical protein